MDMRPTPEFQKLLNGVSERLYSAYELAHDLSELTENIAEHTEERFSSLNRMKNIIRYVRPEIKQSMLIAMRDLESAIVMLREELKDYHGQKAS